MKSRAREYTKNIVILALFLITVSFYFSMKIEGCFIRNISGYHCPGCGGKRSLKLLLNGNFVSSLQANILLIPALISLFSTLVYYLCKLCISESKVTPISINKKISIVLFVIVTFYTLIRNIDYFSFLRPQ